MNTFSNNEKVDMLFIFAKCNKNAERASQMYYEEYPGRIQPNRTYFKKLEIKLRENGSFSVPKKRKCITVNCDENKQNVHYKNNNNEDVSLREIEVECNIAKDSARKILRKNGLKPYKIKSVHHLRVQDFERRQEFCRWLNGESVNDPLICHKILWSDESYFTNNGMFNRNNHCRWLEVNDNQYRQTNFQQRFEVNVWVGILDKKVMYHIFEENLTSPVYLNFLQNELEELLEDLPLNVLNNYTYFQQDGAPAHNAQICVNYLNNVKPNFWIGTNGPIKWPPRSPDPTPLDFFLWGYVKDKVFITPPTDVEDLKNKIRIALNSISPRMLRNALEAVLNRAQHYLRNGQQFEHLL